MLLLRLISLFLMIIFCLRADLFASPILGSSEKVTWDHQEFPPPLQHSWFESYQNRVRGSAKKIFAPDLLGLPLRPLGDQELYSRISQIIEFDPHTTTIEDGQFNERYVLPVEKAFEKHCVIQDEKPIKSEHHWRLERRESFFSNPIVGFDSCQSLMSYYQFACYQVYRSGLFEDQKQICGRYATLSTLLDSQNQEEELAEFYASGKTQGTIFVLDARIKASSALPEKKRTAELKKIIGEFPQIGTLGHLHNQYDGWFVYSRALFERARLESSQKTRVRLLLRALVAIKNAQLVEKRSNEFTNLAFHRGGLSAYAEKAIKMASVKEKIKSKAKNENTQSGDSKLDQNSSLISELKAMGLRGAQDEDMDQLLVDEEQKKLNLKIILSSIQNDTGYSSHTVLSDISLASGVAKDNDTFSKYFEDNPVTELILQIEDSIKKFEKKYQPDTQLKVSSYESWSKKYFAIASISVLKRHLVPKLTQLTHSVLEEIDEILKNNEKDVIQILPKFVPPPDNQLSQIATNSVFSDFFIVRSIIKTQIERKEPLSFSLLTEFYRSIKVSYDSNDPVVRDYFSYFIKYSDEFLAEIFQFPISTESVLSGIERRSLDEIYRQWLKTKINSINEKTIDSLYRSEDPFEQAQGRFYSDLIFKHLRIKAHHTLKDLETLLTSRNEGIEAYLKERINLLSPEEKLSLSRDLYSQDLGAAPSLLALLFVHHSFDLSKDDFRKKFEKQVLKKEAQTYQGTPFDQRLIEALELLGYSEISTNFLYSQLLENGISLDEVLRRFLLETLREEIKKALTIRTPKEFEQENAARVLSHLYENYLQPELQNYSLDQVRALIAALKVKTPQLGKILNTIDSKKDWKKEKTDFNSGEKFLWNRSLHRKGDLNKEDYQKEVEKLLIKKNRRLFKDETFIQYLEMEFMKLGFGELDSLFVESRLSNQSADLDKLLKEYLSLEESWKDNLLDSIKKRFQGLSLPFDIDIDLDLGINLPNFKIPTFFGLGIVYEPNLHAEKLVYKRLKSSNGKFAAPISKEMLEKEQFLISSQELDKNVKTYRVVHPIGVGLRLPKLMPSEGFRIQSEENENNTEGQENGFWEKVGDELTDLADGIDYQVSVHRNANAPGAKTLEKRPNDGNTPEYRNYYLEDHISGIRLDRKTKEFLEELKVHYKALQKEEATEPLTTTSEVFTQFREFLIEMYSGSKHLENVESFIDQRVLNLSLPQYQKKSNAQILLAEAVANWFAVHFTHTGLGTLSLDTLPGMDKFFEKSESNPNWGEPLQEYADTLQSNCYETNALYQYVMREYFEMPARHALGIVGEQSKVSWGPYQGFDFSSPLTDGHAWSEILIDGSWITMDATPIAEQEKKGLISPFFVKNSNGDDSDGKNFERLQRKRKRVEIIMQLLRESCSANTWKGYFEDLAIKLEDFDIDLATYKAVIDEIKKLISNGTSLNCHSFVFFMHGIPIDLDISTETDLNEEIPFDRFSDFKNFPTPDDIGGAESFRVESDYYQKVIDDSFDEINVTNVLRSGFVGTTKEISNFYAVNLSLVQAISKSIHTELFENWGPTSIQTFVEYGGAILVDYVERYGLDGFRHSPNTPNVLRNDASILKLLLGGERSEGETLGIKNQQAVINALADEIISSDLDFSKWSGSLVRRYGKALAGYSGKHSQEIQMNYLKEFFKKFETDSAAVITFTAGDRVLHNALSIPGVENSPYFNWFVYHAVRGSSSIGESMFGKYIFQSKDRIDSELRAELNSNLRSALKGVLELQDRPAFRDSVIQVITGEPHSHEYGRFANITELTHSGNDSRFYDIFPEVYGMNSSGDLFGKKGNQKADYGTHFIFPNRVTSYLGEVFWSRKNGADPSAPTIEIKEELDENIEKMFIDYQKTVGFSKREVISSSQRKMKAFTSEAESAAGLTVPSYLGRQKFDSVGTADFLSKVEDLLSIRSLDQLIDRCLRTSFLILDADQGIRNKDPKTLIEELAHYYDLIPESIWTQEDENYIGNYMKYVQEGNAQVSLNDYNIFRSELVTFTGEKLSQSLRDEYASAISKFESTCLPYLGDFFERAQSEAYQKNWIHLQTIVAIHRLKEGTLPQIQYLIELLQSAHSLKRIQKEERSLTPRLLDLVAAVLPFYTQNNPELIWELVKPAQDLLLDGDLTSSELQSELQRFALASAMRFNHLTSAPYTRIIEAFLGHFDDRQRFLLAEWVMDTEKTLVEEVESESSEKTEEKLESLNLFTLHFLSRINLETSEDHLMKYPLIALRYEKLGEDFATLREEGRMKKFELEALLSAARNSLFIDFDANPQRVLFDAIYDSQSLLEKHASPEMKAYLRSYYELATRIWDKDSTTTKLTKTEVEYVINSRKANDVLKSIGEKPIDFEALRLQSYDPPIKKDW